MSFLKEIYDKSPIYLQELMTTLSGYYKNRSRYGNVYYEHREFLEDFDKWSIDRKLSYQQNELAMFVKNAYNNSLFYQNLYRNVNIEDIKTTCDLKKLPYVDKELIRENINGVYTIDNKKGVIAHTGGTTGKSLEVIFTKEDMMKRMAQLDHSKARVGFENLKMKKATFSGNHLIPLKQKDKKYWRYNAASKQMLYSTFHLNENNMSYYIESLNSFKPAALDGFFSSILDIANYIERYNITLTFTPIAIFPTSETLTEEGRKQIEKAFKCKVYNQYGSAEGAPFISECSKQNLHMELASGVFEYFDSSEEEILVTSFTTNGTPLIRYRIGDSLTLDTLNVNCECGISTPIVKEIHGRKLDFLYTSDGGKINSANIANIFKNIPNAIIKAQLIQDTMDEIKIILETDKDLYKKEFDNKIKDEIKHKFGEKTNVIIQHVNQIPKEKSGKFRMIKNYIDNPE